MESASELKINERQQLLGQWLREQLGSSLRSYTMMPGDASFRRYARVVTDNGSFVVMDSPPPQENCLPFIAIAKALRARSVLTPDILAENSRLGFLLLTDFGDTTYLKALTTSNADMLYQQALDTLAIIQGCRDVPGMDIPFFDAQWMWREWAWHQEWFLEKLLQISPNANLDKCYEMIVTSAVNQPQVFMHRDYHSANLMVTPAGVGVLDFQDAFIGPLTYDLVSLLRDCYIAWPDTLVQQWVRGYLQKLQAQHVGLDLTFDTLLRWFDLMGLQRHLKALLTFARKHVRDQQSHYLKHVPRTLNYVIQVSERYPELKLLTEFMMNTVQPAVLRMPQCAP